MGVKGLWQLLEPVGRSVTLESLEGKILSVDSSIMLNQAVKGMRDKSGNPLPNAHLIVLFNRLCKLLFYRVKPIFVFDGGVPVLKKKTLAARRERKFKARHGSNKATEKLVKNYLKGKALETVTGRKCSNTVFRNKSQTDTDIFELQPINRTQEAVQGSSSEEDNGQQFSGQHDIEKKFQNPSCINVDSEDFRSLPEEIQHELIKDIIEEKKWSTIQSMPQDAFDFSDYQLQSVLQRGKLHQRLEELRKEMNNRNNGEVSGLTSQDTLGANSSVLSQRIISQDSAHYVLIKTSKTNTNRSGGTDTDSQMVGNLTEGGFLREDQEVHYQQSKPVMNRPKPSFNMDLAYENSSDSEPDSSLLEVPEVVPRCHNFGEQQNKTKQSNFDTEVERNSDVSYGEANPNPKNVKGKDALEHQSVHAFSKDMDENEHERKSEDSLTPKTEVVVSDGEKNTRMEETLNEVNLNRDETKENESIEAQIEKRRNQIEIMLSKRQAEGNLFTHQNIVEKTFQDTEFPNNPTTDIENNSRVLDNDISVLSSNDGSIEFRLHIESSSDEEEEETTSREHEVTSEKIQLEDVKVRQDMQHDRAESLVKDDIEDKSVISDQKKVLYEDEDNELKESNVLEAEDVMDTVTGSHEETHFVLDENSTEEAASSPMSAPSVFAGTSKEDWQVMQENLEMEQHSIQAERARQERMAATLSNEMLTESQELLQLFGVPYLVSPMEAEAQCAFLDFTQQTSGTITDDSDVFLFGGTRVYKNIFNQNKHAELYTLDAITGYLALDRSKMIKLAFITGSDYTEGIQGLGAVGAMEVLHEFNNDGFEALLKFKKWHDETKGNKYPKQETKVKQKLRTLTLPTGFPSQEVFNSYINPVVDNSHEAFEWGKPDLHGLRLFAREKLGWSVDKTDEILLPVVQQINKHETQMRMDDFFQIKFHEPRKKSSKRVRRVINRFLNPLSSSDSSSDDDEGKTKKYDTSDNKRNINSQISSEKGKGKRTESRKKAIGPRVTRGRGRGQSRGRHATGNAVNTEQSEGTGNVRRRSVISKDTVESDTLLRDSEGGTEGHGSGIKRKGRRVQKQGKIKNNQEIQFQEKSKINVTKKDNYGKTQYNGVGKPQSDHNKESKNCNILLSKFENNDKEESMPGFVNRKNVKNKMPNIPKNSCTTRKEEAASSGSRNMNENSPKSSDTDSEDGQSISTNLKNISRINKNGGRGVGRKRTRGKGRGREVTRAKRSKLEIIKSGKC